MGNPKRIAGVVAALVITSVIAGCSSGGIADPTASAVPTTPTPSATSAAAVDFGTTPSPTISCDALLPSDEVRALVPGATTTDRIAMPEIEGSWFAAATVGGIECAAGNGVSPVGDRSDATIDDPQYQGVVVTVIPDAEAAFADYLADITEDGSVMAPCRASDAARLSCNEDAVAGKAWVSVSSTRIQDSQDADPETARPLIDALLGKVLAAVSASPLASASGSSAQHAVAPTNCSPARVNAVTTAPLIDGWAQTDYFRTAGLVALARADADRCAFAVKSGDRAYDPGAYYTALPDGAWVVEQRLAAGTIDRSDRLTLDGLGAADGAWRSCDRTACSVDVVHDGDWTHYVLLHSVAPDTSSAIERWVRSSWKP